MNALRGISANGTNIYYSDGEEYLRFPVNFGDQFTDDLYSTFFSGANFIRDGSVTIDVDGYGTMTLPDGTVVTDVVRVHAQENYTDEVPNITSTTTSTDLYFFYKAGVHYPILNIATVTNPQQSGSYMEYIEHTPNGINDRAAFSVNVYPNPTTDRIYLNTREKFDFVNVRSNTGALVMSSIPVTKTGFDVSDLTAGIYFLEAVNEDGEIYRAKFLKQ